MDHNFGGLVFVTFRGKPGLEQGCKPLDGTQGITDFMSHPCSQTADSRQLFLALDLFLKTTDLTKISENENLTHQTSVFGNNSGSAHSQRNFPFTSQAADHFLFRDHSLGIKSGNKGSDLCGQILAQQIFPVIPLSHIKKNLCGIIHKRNIPLVINNKQSLGKICDHFRRKGTGITEQTLGHAQILGPKQGEKSCQSHKKEDAGHYQRMHKVIFLGLFHGGSLQPDINEHLFRQLQILLHP